MPPALLAVCRALLLSPFLLACSEKAAPPGGLCAGEFTPVAAVQGDGYTSPLLDSPVSVSGVVTWVEPGDGFYIEDSASAAAGNASRGLFVAADSLPAVATGQRVAVHGRVAETGTGRDTLTALVDAVVTATCAEGLELPLSSVQLPLDSRQREALEGMRVAFANELFVTDHYNLHRGEWTLSADGPLRIPTEDALPGDDAAGHARNNRLRELPVGLPGPDYPALPVGTAVRNVSGVMGHDGRGQRLLSASGPQTRPIATAADLPPAETLLRIVSANLLNYFNGDGRGGGFPTERGARTLREFEAQRDRTRAALAKIQPHLLAVQELENDGFGPDSAARSLLDLLNETGNGDWEVIDPGSGPIGGDVITVGLFYRREALEPVGPPRILQGPAFAALSRQPLAQRFRERASGQEFLVAVNHLKSKGRCPETGPDSDRGDGQGCWNRARVDAVSALAQWLDEPSGESATERVLVVGDMNAWRLEAPIHALREAGYLELVEERSGLPEHSFLYFGQRGTLDYAFASPAMARAARRAFIWHINADWPRDMTLPLPWLRMSDHDPVIVDLDFSQASTAD